jgi:hypothetical protein
MNTVTLKIECESNEDCERAKYLLRDAKLIAPVDQIWWLSEADKIKFSAFDVDVKFEIECCVKNKS